jgi:hypothetical protein
MRCSNLAIVVFPELKRERWIIWQAPRYEMWGLVTAFQCRNALQFSEPRAEHPKGELREDAKTRTMLDREGVAIHNQSENVHSSSIDDRLSS